MVEQTDEGTVPWTAAQKAELTQTGEVDGYTGHHINNVAQYPDWSGDPAISESCPIMTIYIRVMGTMVRSESRPRGISSTGGQ